VSFRYSPDAPSNLQNDATASSDTQIRITFTAPNPNGAAITEYTIWIAQNSNAFTQAKTNNTFYTTVNPLVPGANYTFKVQAANSFGSSEMSLPITVLAATKPDPPLSVATSNVQDLI
jgi:hypothetical protein